MGKFVDRLEIAKRLEEEDEINRQLARQIFSQNLFAFNQKILQVEEGENNVPLQPFHQELCQFIEEKKKRRKLVLLPRMHLKSTLITVGYSLQAICRNPSIRILIANATADMAQTFLTQIKRHLEKNERLREIWGGLTEESEKWTERAITLSQAKVIGGRKEATVVAYGMGGNLVSQHYDIIILDDIVNRDFISTREQINKTINFYRDALSLLEPGGELIILGTRWDDADLYGWILNKENNVLSQFEVMTKKAYEGNLRTGEDLKILFPNKFNRDYLRQLYRELGPYEFSCQFMNSPVSAEDAVFRKDWFHYYEEVDVKGLIMNRFTLIDPAISTDVTADYSAIVTVGIDQYANIYLLDIVRQRMPPDRLIQEIFYANERWYPLEIGLETVAYQRVLRYALLEEMKKRNRYLPIKELQPHAQTKEQRIRGLQPLYANGIIYHNRNLIHNDDLEFELLRFPRGRNDDIIDALAYLLDLAFPPKRKVSHHKSHYLYG